MTFHVVIIKHGVPASKAVARDPFCIINDREFFELPSRRIRGIEKSRIFVSSASTVEYSRFGREMASRVGARQWM